MKKILFLLSMFWAFNVVNATEISLEKTGSLIDIPNDFVLVGKKEFKTQNLNYILTENFSTPDKNNYLILNIVESQEKDGKVSALSPQGLKTLSRLEQFKLKESILQALIVSFNKNKKYSEVKLGNPEFITVNNHQFLTIIGKAKMDDKDVKIISLMTGFNSNNVNLTFNYLDNKKNDDLVKKIGFSFKPNIFKK